MNEKEILALSIKDLLTRQMLKFSLMPFLISMVVLYIIFFYFAGMSLDQLGTMSIESSQTSIVNGIPHTESTSTFLQGSSIIQFLMSHALTSWLASFFIYTIGGFFTLYISIFIATIILGFLTPYILKELQKRHYPDIEMIGYSNIFESLFLVIKWAFIMMLLFFLLVPLYFIPLINIIAFNLPLYYFFHKMLTYDIASNICTREEDKKIRYFNGTNLKIKTALLYLLSLIPFIIFFGAIFYVIYLGNSYFNDLKKVRSEVNEL